VVLDYALSNAHEKSKIKICTIASYNKKNNVQISSNTFVFNPLSQIPLTTNDDISLVNSRRLSSKEVKRTHVKRVSYTWINTV
jgi:predicted RNA methylase